MNLPSTHVCCCCCNNECCNSSGRINPIHSNNSANFCPNNNTASSQEEETYVAHLSPKRKRQMSFLASFRQTLGTNRQCVHVVCVFSVILLSFVSLAHSSDIPINSSNFLNGESTPAPASPFGNPADFPSIPTGSSSSLNNIVVPGPSSSPATQVGTSHPPSTLTQSYFINGYANLIQRTNVSDLRALAGNEQFQLQFRTVCPFGNIINDDKFALRFNEAGYLTYLKLPQEIQSIQSKNIVADGRWHSVTFSGSKVFLDDPDSNNRYGISVDWDSGSSDVTDNHKLYFFDGFVGCIRLQLPANNTVNPNNLDTPQSSPAPADQDSFGLFKGLQKYQPCNDFQFDLRSSAQCFQAKSFVLCSQCQNGATCVFTDGKNECECPEPEDETIRYEPPLCNRVELSNNRSFAELTPESREFHAVLSDDDMLVSSTTGSSRSSFPPQSSPQLSSSTEHMEASSSIEQSRIQPEIENCSCVHGQCITEGDSWRCDCTGTNFRGRRCNNDVCDEVPGRCGEYGKCFDAPESESGFECYCKPGFSGELCNINFNECLSNPCINGTCEDAINTYSCVCHPGYTGKNCETDINECESNPCQFDSTCLDQVADYTCECMLGYTGKNCEVDIDDCAPVPCKNNGICIDGINDYKCNCEDTGFFGTNCEENVNDCESSPCQHGGICTDEVKAYNCSCYAGYIGDDCETDIEECQDNTCNYHGQCYEKSHPHNYEHGGVLSDLDFSYATAAGHKCVCMPGFEGENCEVDINECQLSENPSPCNGRGKCIDDINMYRCECDKGFEGEHCETDINECEPNPCNFSSSCKDLAGDYLCECIDGYGGKNCTVPLTGCVSNVCYHEGVCTAEYDEITDVHSFKCACKSGFTGDTCNIKTTMAFNGSSLVEVVKNDDAFENNKYTLNFQFQTTLPDVVLAVGEGGTYFHLGLAGGKLHLRSSLINHLEGMWSGNKLHDGKWHRVAVSINSTHAILSADIEQVTLPIAEVEDSLQQPTGFNLTLLGNLKPIYSFLNNNDAIPFVGCMQDVKINDDRILPEEADNVNLTNILSQCERKDQCRPNPCQNGGTCTDLWKKFTCNCPRPHLGGRCQYSYIPATFSHEDTRNSLATVDIAPGQFGGVFDISMFVRTRESRGTIFLLCNKERGLNGSYIEAIITKSGNLVVQAKWTGSTDAGDETSIKPEPYTVDGSLSDGQPHLISVQRDKSFVVIKVDDSEHFRKSHSNRIFSPTVMYIGGRPAHLSGQDIPVSTPLLDSHSGETSTSFPDGSVDNNTEGTAADSEGSTDVLVPEQYSFKGTIQDVRVNLSSPDASPALGHTSHLKQQKVFIVEFFNLTEIHQMNPPLGRVAVQNLLQGSVSDDHCKSSPCFRGVCNVTWNDFKCDCFEGYDGKECDVRLRCADVTCPGKSTCQNIGHSGFECNVDASFDGKGHTTPHYILKSTVPTSDIMFTELSFKYRSKRTGNVIHISNGTSFLRISLDIHDNESAAQIHFINNFKLHIINNTILDGEWHSLSLKFASHENPTDASVSLSYDKNDTTFPFDYNSHNYLRDLVLSPTVDIVVGSSLSIDDYGRPISNDPGHSHSQYYRGCLRDVSIGSFKLPFISQSKLEESNVNITNKSLIELTAPTAFYINEKLHNSEQQLPRLGCILCYEKDCKNGGRCAEPYQFYDCSCAAGFEGETCDRDIDECQDNRCDMGSTCIDGINNYTCSCVTGYDGWLCQNNINECEGEEKCNLHGECIDGIGEYKCICSEDFTGSYCEKPKKSTCRDTPCENGATCNEVGIQPNGVSFKCHCAPGWEGEFCSERIDYCKRGSVDCGNGKCENTFFGYKCNCVQGFDGIHCDVNIDECSPSPCKNKGNCIDGIDSFTCNCNDTGFTGPICEHDVDECQEDSWHTSQSLCEEPLICENFVGSYQCICINKDMCGAHCDVPNPCYSPENVTCHNDGTCKANCDDPNDPTYSCICRPGFEGHLCEQQALLQRPADESGIDILLIIIPVLAAILIAATVGIIILVRMARRKRATRGVYSPSQQEYCNPRVELDNVMKPPPEERLI